MYGKRGRSQPSSGSQFQHNIDYAGLPRDVEEEELEASKAGTEAHAAPASASAVGPISLQLTRALQVKLTRMASDEGVTLEQLLQELLAEGVTLRAWEIIERKSAMRGPSQDSQGGGSRPFQSNGPRRQGGPGGHQGHGSGGPQSGRRGPPPGKGMGTAWMEDKAAFLEYVRNQEKPRRR